MLLSAQSTPDEDRLREAAGLRSTALADMEEGNYARAAEKLERLGELLPDNVLPAVNLSICYLRLDRREEALRQILRARRLSPDNPQLLFSFATLLGGPEGDRALWQEILDEFIESHPGDPRPHFLLGRRAEDDGDWAAAQAALTEASRRAPENLVPLVELFAAAAQNADLDATEDALYGIEDRLNGFDGSAERLAREIEDALLDGEASAVRPRAMALRNVLRPTELYQIGLDPLIGRQGGLELFPQIDFEPALPASIQGGQDPEISFQEQPAPLDRPLSHAIWVARPGSLELLLVATDGQTYSWKPQEAPAPIDIPGLATSARALLALDLDQDERTDLLTLAPTGLALHRGLEGASLGFGEPRTLLESTDLERAFPLDPDQDGDLDLLLATTSGPVRFLRNDGAGFSDRTAEMGVSGVRHLRDVVAFDFDDDGDLDLLTVAGSGVNLWGNERSGPLVDRSERLGSLSEGAPFIGALAEDFDRDGHFDLLLWGTEGALLLANRAGSFSALDSLSGVAGIEGPWLAAVAADFDNDGDRDAVARIASSVVLLRNRGGELSPEVQETAAPDSDSDSDSVRLIHFDPDLDGDLDVVALGNAAPLRVHRNEGGDRNAWVRLSLQGLNTDNAKNNTQGLFARIETRVGDVFQVRLGNGGVNHIGLGARRQADVIRVIWTNGLAQTWQQVSSERTLVERQVLKGSCPFLYTWNGSEFTFVTDLMWRSTLGMHFPDGSPMPHQSARDWVKIPGDALLAGEEAWLQVTAELWEAVYVDRQSLVAVDYPARDARGEEVHLHVDERFTPPPHSREPPLAWAIRPRPPQRATLLRTDGPRDVLDAVRLRDGVHVDALPLTRYQGVTEEHALELEFALEPSAAASLTAPKLLLAGWIFPTDTTINRALEQNPDMDAAPPRLEVQRPDGSFTELYPSIGIPNGKRKELVIDLGVLPKGILDSDHLTLRLVTSMQIYWDAAALLPTEPQWGDSGSMPRRTALDPDFADLHYRGFSRLYRESPSGPHLFDASEPSFERPFRDMKGRYTRYGDVLELALAEDDRMVVMSQGDTLLLRYATAQLPPLPEGWKRDWLLYTDGWVKDADLATETSQTVEPLPHHGLESYPDPARPFPDTEAHRDWLERYQTRELDDSAFRRKLQPEP